MIGFGKRFQDLRTLKNKTQKDMAMLLNVSLSTVNSWETKDRSPRIRAVISAAKFFGVSVNYLLGL